MLPAAHGFDHADRPRQHGGAGDQHVHAQPAAAQFVPGTDDEGPAGPEHHRGGHHEGDPAEKIASGQGHLAAGIEVQRLGEHHRLHRADAGQANAQQVAIAGTPACRLAGFAGGQVGPVAERGQPRQWLRQRRACRIPLDADAPGDGIGGGIQHAGFAAQGAVDQPGAGGAAHAVGEHGDFTATGDGVGVAGQQLFAVPRRQCRCVGVHPPGGLVTQAVVILQVGIDDPARGRRATFATELMRLAVDLHAQRCRRQCFAAVMAGIGGGAGQGGQG